MQITSGNKPHKGVSKRLKLCKICNKVWEIVYQTKKVIHHEDFPTYGLERKNCNDCKLSRM